MGQAMGGPTCPRPPAWMLGVQRDVRAGGGSFGRRERPGRILDLECMEAGVRIKTRRWNDAPEPDDGLRILVSRYRPRGLRKDDETWDVWLKDLGPSVDLHAAAYGKAGEALPWAAYARRYLEEMADQTELLASLRARAEEGETLTLLCSSACEDPDRCHRTLLKLLLEQG